MAKKVVKSSSVKRIEELARERSHWWERFKECDAELATARQDTRDLKEERDDTINDLHRALTDRDIYRSQLRESDTRRSALAEEWDRFQNRAAECANAQVAEIARLSALVNSYQNVLANMIVSEVDARRKENA
jgi:hypothetical protein